MTPPTRWLEIAVPAQAEAVEAVSEILTRVGYNGIAVEVPLQAGKGTDHTVKAYLVEDADAFAKVSDVRDALGHLQAFGLGPIGELVARRVEDKDWLESWKAEFVPIRIGAFLVRPTWAQATTDEAVELVLDPGMAFGTGLHPTTQQCLEALSTFPVDGKSLLDVGTGSGILAIAAAKRGASPVVAVDTDALAVDAARENATRNGVAIPVGEGSAADVPGRFDVVVANIVSPVLQRIAPDLAARLAGGGTLLVAGISAPAESATRDAFAHVRLQVLDRTERDDWVALALGR
ncbi:MAG TPA: 50S ribosomal protein L11 methyltransferase [Candidatus Limnocylindria bacterium]|jgi:ribosomal protein L11 methyltransferase|nr:50S ribosomal protein L11 methyltransferase [Candidatus Limnocylindria bacterium]